MSAIETAALVVIVLVGLYLLALGAVSLAAPSRASRFLLGFASTPFVHFSELFLRGVVGVALVLYAPRMALAEAFGLFGWVLLVTTVCLIFVPWRWHQRFAQHAVPHATRHMTLMGLASLILGGLLLAAVWFSSEI